MPVFPAVLFIPYVALLHGICNVVQIVFLLLLCMHYGGKLCHVLLQLITFLHCVDYIHTSCNFTFTPG